MARQRHWQGSSSIVSGFSTALAKLHSAQPNCLMIDHDEWKQKPLLSRGRRTGVRVLYRWNLFEWVLSRYYCLINAANTSIRGTSRSTSSPIFPLCFPIPGKEWLVLFWCCLVSFPSHLQQPSQHDIRTWRSCLLTWSCGSVALVFPSYPTLAYQ